MDKKNYSREELLGMTVNERLFVAGLMEEFDKAKMKDKNRAMEILKQIYVDIESIKKILNLKE